MFRASSSCSTPSAIDSEKQTELYEFWMHAQQASGQSQVHCSCRPHLKQPTCHAVIRQRLVRVVSGQSCAPVLQRNDLHGTAGLAHTAGSLVCSNCSCEWVCGSRSALPRGWRKMECAWRGKGVAPGRRRRHVCTGSRAKLHASATHLPPAWKRRLQLLQKRAPPAAHGALHACRQQGTGARYRMEGEVRRSWR